MTHYGEELTAEFKTYTGGGTAIQLKTLDGEPYATATVNVPNVELEDDEVIIKTYSENEGILEALIEANIVENTGRMVLLGHVHVPICKLIRNDEV